MNQSLALHNDSRKEKISSKSEENASRLSSRLNDIVPKKKENKIPNILKTNDKHDTQKNYEKKRSKILQSSSIISNKDKVINKRSQDGSYQICKGLRRTYGVRPGITWGSMQNKADQRALWTNHQCDAILKVGHNLSCNDTNGYGFIENWKLNKDPIYLCDATDTVETKNTDHYCTSSYEGNQACTLYNLILDFKKMKVKNNAKIFEDDFAKIKCPSSSTIRLKSIFNKYLPGLHVDRVDHQSKYSHGNQEECDEIVTEPTLIVSHDCTFNLGHLFEDILNWWMIAEVKNLNRNKTILLNIDGLRPATIHNGKGRWAIIPQTPDAYGPFSKLLSPILFKNAIDLHKRGWSQKRICFKEAHFFPFPLKAFVWQKISVDDRCSYFSKRFNEEYYQNGDIMRGANYIPAPSSLYTKFHDDYIKEWKNYLGSKMNDYNLIGTDNRQIHTKDDVLGMNNNQQKDKLRILFLIRSKSESEKRAEFIARNIMNLDEILLHIRKELIMNGNHELVVEDFSQRSFDEQVIIVHNIDILITMHGAGGNHIFHMNQNRIHCCGLITLYPKTQGCSNNDEKICRFYGYKELGNHARYLGYEYLTLVGDRNSFHHGKGTYLDKVQLWNTIDKMLNFLLN